MRRANRFQQRRANDPNSIQNLRQRNRREIIFNRATNQNNQKRIISFRRRLNRRNRVRVRPRFRYNFRKNQRVNNNNYTNKINSINQKVNDLASDFEKLAIKNNSVVNKFKTKKEMRDDMLISAMNMVKYSSKLGFFKTNLKVVKSDFYMKYDMTVREEAKYVFWTPYAFPNVSKDVKVTKNNSVGIPDTISSVIFYVDDNNIWAEGMDITSLSGSCRLISATMHIMNTSPATAKQGTYSIYQLHDNTITPILLRQDFGQSQAEITAGVYKFYKAVINGPINTISNKMTFSASEEGYIDEYNTHEGTNMFGSTYEYINCVFENPDNYPNAIPTSTHYPYNSPNPIGSNITYLLKFPGVSTPQTYMFETWTIWEVAPSVESGLGNLASIDNRIFSQDVYNSACNAFPFHKST